MTVVRKDKAGKDISAKYTPTVRPGTDFVDEMEKKSQDTQVKMENNLR